MKSIQLEESYHMNLKILSAILNKTIKDLLVESLNLLSKKYEKEIQNAGIRKTFV
jgi:hypothetical protein